jgi:hypothetical protein
MLKELDEYDWEEAFAASEIKPTITAKAASLEGVTRENVKRIVAMVLGENDGPNWTGVFEMNDGRFISVCAGCDYTGWDCYGEGEIFVAYTQDDIIRYGLSNDERERLKLAV